MLRRPAVDYPARRCGTPSRAIRLPASGSERRTSEGSRARRYPRFVLRRSDTFAAARSPADQPARPLKRILLPVAAKIVHFFARWQVEWNFAAGRALEALVRSLDERDRWVSALVARVRAAEERVSQLEAELRGARAAEEDTRRKLANVGIRLRELGERSEGRGSGNEADKD
jgi:hypothetical protein